MSPLRRRTTWLTLTLALLIVACDRSGPPGDGDFSFGIDTSLTPVQATLPGIAGGSEREIAVLAGPKGETMAYVVDEVVFQPESEADLDAFLERYGGAVLRDGTPPIPPEGGAPSAAQVEPSGWYLIRIDPTRTSSHDLTDSLRNRGIDGHHRFSSEAAAGLAALLARETDRYLHPNFLFESDAVNEHPDDGSGFLNAEDWSWMTEDDDPNTPGDQGLSVGVIHAWSYLRYHGVPPSSGTFEPPVIAIIDGGFDVDASGNGSLDFFPRKPLQFDLIDYDASADGPNLMTCGGSQCPWHGTGAFGVALARHGNRFGGAGTSGNVAWPMLIRTDSSFYGIGDAIRTAAIHGADVISLSLGGGCVVAEWVCAFPPDDIYSHLQSAVDLAVTGGAVVLAAAGNEGIDLATTDSVPCELERVICVGSVDPSTMNIFNYGSAVDIWAPTNIYATVGPQEAMADADDVGADELYDFGGTSASTPFVAGVVATMKALDPNLSWSQVRDILQETANPSADARVAHGYVDAYRAVRRVRENPAPSIVITRPTEGASVSYRRMQFQADASDPDLDDPDSGEVTWTSDRDGELCRVEGLYFAGLPNRCVSSLPRLSLGSHAITATATDVHGATAQDSVTIEAVNHAPTIEVTRPVDGATFFANQTIALGANANDQDEGFAGDGVRWESDRDGFLGTGWSLPVSLSVGTHAIRATVTDELGSVAEDGIALVVLSGEGVPSATILEPTVRVVSPGTAITFAAEASDPEDGVLTGESLQWFSSIDGHLGSGAELQAVLSGPETACDPEFARHAVTLEVSDSDGHLIREQIGVSVGRVC